nr:hypothetical protein [Prescottella equi]
MVDIRLETPQSSDALYLALGDDVDAFRPGFTGDVYEHKQLGLLMLLQHPCAMRKGLQLHPRLLAATVSPAEGLRSDWHKSPYTLMPLPRLLDSRDHSASFIDLMLVTPDDLERSRRIATMTQVGVNLCLQRWVHHNSRVVIPTITFAEQTLGPFEEADLAQDWAAERESLSIAEAFAEFDSWIRDSPDGSARTRQAMLGDPQCASAVRREARAHLKTLG